MDHKLARFLSLIVIMGIMSTVSGSCASEKDEKSKALDAVAVAAGTGAVVSGLGSASTLAGFTTAGIVKGSMAATIQSTVGTGVVFSTLQSLGATGAMTIFGPITMGAAAVGGAAYYIFG